MTDQHEAQPSAPYGTAIPGSEPGAQSAAEAPQNPYGVPPQNPYGAPPQNPYGSAPEPPRASRKRFIRPLIGISIVAVLAIGGKIAQDHSSSKRDSSGNISKAGDLDAFSLKAGDCFQDPTAGVDISSVKAIPCDQPHTAQVFADVEYPNPPSTTPDETTLKATVEPLCTDAAVNKVDEKLVRDDAGLVYFVAQGKAWSNGHHDVLCVMDVPTPTTGTVLK